MSGGKRRAWEGLPITSDLIAQQTALYGEPLSARFGRVLAAYRIPQSRLAAVIGLSAPMLSQLAGGHRVKISNPAVYARLLRLEELSRSPAVVTGDRDGISAALAEVAESQPRLTTDRARTAHETIVDHLAAIAAPSDLLGAAAAVPDSPLAVLLRAAADRPLAPPA